MRVFVYRFSGNGKSELRKIRSSLLTNADKIAL